MLSNSVTLSCDRAGRPDEAEISQQLDMIARGAPDDPWSLHSHSLRSLQQIQQGDCPPPSSAPPVVPSTCSPEPEANNPSPSPSPGSPTPASDRDAGILIVATSILDLELREMPSTQQLQPRASSRSHLTAQAVHGMTDHESGRNRVSRSQLCCGGA